jgi:hypothetical protein
VTRALLWEVVEAVRRRAREWRRRDEAKAQRQAERRRAAREAGR